MVNKNQKVMVQYPDIQEISSAIQILPLIQSKFGCIFSQDEIDDIWGIQYYPMFESLREPSMNDGKLGSNIATKSPCLNMVRWHKDQYPHSSPHQIQVP